MEEKVEGICNATDITQPRQQIVGLPLNDHELRCQVDNDAGELATASRVLVQVSYPCTGLWCSKLLPKVEILLVVTQAKIYDICLVL